MKPLAGAGTAVIVKWQPRSKTVVVATPSGRMMTIHALRPTRVGTRVRIQGVKWGTTIAGVKWGLRPAGVKWGVKWAANGTYSAKLRKIGVAGSTRIRGVVVARNRRAIAVGAPGGVVIIRTAVWLPGGTTTLKAFRPPRAGDVVSVDVRLGTRGVIGSRNLRIVSTAPRPIFVAGTITDLDPVTRTIRLTVSTDPVLPIVLTIPLPADLDIATLATGLEVAGSVIVDPATGGLTLTALGPVANPAVSNDPALQYVAPASGGGATPTSTPGTPANPGTPGGPQPPSPPTTPVPAATLTAISATASAFQAAVTGGMVTDPPLIAQANGLLASTLARAQAGDLAGALRDLTAFAQLVRSGRDAGSIPGAVAAQLMTLANDARARLGATAPVPLPADAATMGAIADAQDAWDATVDDISDSALVTQGTALLADGRSHATAGDLADALAALTDVAELVRSGRDRGVIPDVAANRLMLRINAARAALGATAPVLLPATTQTLAQLARLERRWERFTTGDDPEVTDPTFITRGAALLRDIRAAAVQGDIGVTVLRLRALRALIVAADEDVIRPDAAAHLRIEVDRVLRRLVG